jgi:microcystin-dependent protein
MAYEVSYTDSVNKGVIVVEDSSLNTETTLALPGRGSTAYGQAVAENFLHLLENFANTNPPARPVEGQLWYDNTDGVNQLKVYDGTTWVASGGLKKAAAQPAVANSIAGDLWVNTESQQLYLFTGSAWVLVGPSFSDGLLTGVQAEAVVGTDNVTYNVLVIKIEDTPAAIISSQAFVPKSTIIGFRSGIQAGFNIATTALVGSQDLKYYGIAEKAENLIVSGDVVAASNFLRGDAASTTNYQLKVKTNEGLQVGSGGQINIKIAGESGVIQHNTPGANIDFVLRDGNISNTVMRIDSTQKVGINNTAPEEDLDVVGNVQISSKSTDSTTGVLKVTSTIQSADTGTGSLIVSGGAGIGLNLNVGGDTEVAGILTTANITPDSNSLRNIGNPTNKYDQVYATTFFGNLQGNVSGTVTGRAGSADRLASATTFAVTGDVENNSFAFDGQTGGSTKTFDLTIRNSFISNKDVIYDVDNADEILVNKVIGDSGLFRVTKRNFLKSIPLIPAGSILPYGGQDAPIGWLLCDGSEVKKSDYTLLWQAIGFNFRDASLISDSGVNYFALPDMRGRFALGADNMGGPSANRVTSSAADAIGNGSGEEIKTIGILNLPEHEHDLEGESGTQYYGIRAGAGEPLDAAAITLPIEPGLGGTQGLASSGGIKTDATLGTPLDVMNPYLVVNYIIYTGE